MNILGLCHHEMLVHQSLCRFFFTFVVSYYAIFDSCETSAVAAYLETKHRNLLLFTYLLTYIHMHRILEICRPIR